MEPRSDLGKRIGDLRRERGWSVPELARAAEVVESTVYRLEEGTEPRSGTMQKIARALGVTVAELLDRPYAEEPVAPAVVHPGIEALASPENATVRQTLGLPDDVVEAARRWVFFDASGAPVTIQTVPEAVAVVQALLPVLQRRRR